ncbi:MAG TPA: RDD family protein [Streptosporangiaceae bacterium]|nr:RDD family protein [Streptosporangiaceae bacterium]
MTQQPDDQGSQPPPAPQPFTMPGQPPDGSPGQPPDGSPGQPAGAAPGQQYGAYRSYPGTSRGAPGYGTRGYGTARYGTGGQTAKDPALAEWWQRLLARLVDDVILVVLTSPLWVSVLLPAFRRVERLASQYPDLSEPAASQAFNNGVSHLMAGMIDTFLLLGAAVGVVSFAYDWLQHGLWGQTIGKRVMGTKVVTADTRSPISGQAACGRAAVYALVPVVPSVGGLFALVNESWLLWDPRRQCLHDKAARTVVVKTSMLPGGAQMPGTGAPGAP